MASGARPALPGGHELGDQLYYTGSNQSSKDGDKLVHGQQGEVVGPATGEHQGNGLQMLFPGNKVYIDCSLLCLSREKPPPLPGGHELGEQLYYTGPNHSRLRVAITSCTASRARSSAPRPARTTAGA